MNAAQSDRWARVSATLGAAAWVVLTSLAGAGRAPLGVIELLFLFAPLVVVPLGLELARKAVPSRSPGLEDAAQALQPFAAALLVFSFWTPIGRTALLLAVPWGIVCLLTAVAGLGLLLRRELSLPGIAAGMARADLAIAAAWLLSSRLGFHLAGFQEPIVLLTAVHFHYTGFATALMAAVALTFARRTGRRLPDIVRGRGSCRLCPVPVGSRVRLFTDNQSIRSRPAFSKRNRPGRFHPCVVRKNA